MNKLQQRIQILFLLSIFFVYKAVMGYINNDMSELTVWLMITIVYSISIIILTVVAMRWKKELNP